MQEWIHQAETTETDWTAGFGGNALETGTTSGLTEGCEVETENGWCPVEDLRPGDRVRTVDDGMQMVRVVERQTLWAGLGECPEAFWPLFLPAGLIGNTRELMVLPDQALRLRTEAGDSPDLLIPAMALAGVPGVDRMPPFGTVEVVRPMFDRDQLVVTDGGAHLFCPADWSPLYDRLREDKAPYRVAGAGIATGVVDTLLGTSPFMQRPITFPPDLMPEAPVNQDNYPVQAKIA